MMYECPKVSVIIPIFQAEAFLSACLECLTNQTLKQIEIICVDDGSEDQSLSIAADYAQKDERVRVLSQEHRGSGAAKNTGLRHARGEYICFVNCKDHVEENALELLVQSADSREVQIVCMNIQPFSKDKKLKKVLEHYRKKDKRSRMYEGIVPGEKMFTDMYWKRDYLPHAYAYMYRRDYLREKQLFFLEGSLHEDEAFTAVALLEAEETYHLPQTLYHWYLTAENREEKRLCYEGFQGYFAAHCELMNCVNKRQLEARTQRAVWSNILELRRKAFRIYAQLPSKEKKGVIWTNDSFTKAMFTMHESAAEYVWMELKYQIKETLLWLSLGGRHV